MLKSMTGYGEASCEAVGMAYSAEIRTVNNRYLKNNMRLPDNLAYLEEEIDKLIKSRMDRGTVNLSIRTRTVSSEPAFEFNSEILIAFAQNLKNAAEQAGIESSINISDLLSLPGVVQPALPDEKETEIIRKSVLETVAQALDKLVTMRKIEGQQLEADLKSNCDDIKATLDKVRTRISVVVQEYKEKLEKRIDDLLKEAQLKIDEQTMIREVAVFADRSDISEEIARLDSHLMQFFDVCQSNESVGRRLDFLCQEMFREVNTIGSKASDSQICQWVVDLKCSVDRIKEQVQNVE